MSGPDSWEDDPASQDDNLSRQTQQNLNLNAQQQAYQQQYAQRQQYQGYQPGAASFTPGAASFQPGQAYGQQYNQQAQYYGGGGNQYGGQYGGYQQNYQQQQYNQYGGQQQYQYGGQQQNAYVPPHQRQQQQQYSAPTQTPTIAKRPDPSTSTPAAASAGNAKPKVLSLSADAPKPKVLSLSAADTKPKVLSLSDTAPKPKVLSLSAETTAPAAKDDEVKTDSPKAESVKGADETPVKPNEKVAAVKASTNGTTSKSNSRPTTPSSQTGEPEKKGVAADAVEKEQAENVDTALLAEVYGKEHVNVIFIGHVDAGKSTLGGSILYATGMVDERTMDKYKREAKELGRETWYLSWALDINKEERAKGKTVEVGKGFFETDKRRYTILDAPGHKTFVPNMIGGAAQADVGLLVISARKGEYETGFEKGGQTREHAMLAKTQGVNQLCVVVNKMDDPTVEWSHDRYKECTEKLLTYLKGCGYAKKDVTVMPISAQTGVNIKDRIPSGVCDWYSGPSLLEYLDNLKSLERKNNAPFMMPVAAKYRELGTMVEGKVEAGQIKKDAKLIMMPNREDVSVAALYGETEDETPIAGCGEQVRVRLRGIEEEDILPGFVLCAPSRLVHTVSEFEAQIVLLDVPRIIAAGYQCVMHVHSAIEEVTFDALLHKLEKGTNRKSKKPPGFASKGMGIIARLKLIGGAGMVCVERFEDYPQMGRFTLRDQGVTIAIGKITKLITDAPPA